MPISPDQLRSLCPLGKLRVAINLGNAVLAKMDSAGNPDGVSVDMARALARKLQIDLELTVVDGAAKSVKAVSTGDADVGFFAVDPLRADTISFTRPYVLIEGAYLVRDNSSIQENSEVDKPGARIVAAKGSAYDLFLSRNIKSATLEYASTSQAVVAKFLDHGMDVAAGVRQQLEIDMKAHSGLRLLPGRFMVIEQAMGVERSRGAGAVSLLQDFVRDQILSGAIASYLQSHQIQGAAVASA